MHRLTVLCFTIVILQISSSYTFTVGPSSSLADVFAATIYAEARGESIEGQEWVGHVIKNRARLNKSYWGGTSIKDVCLKPGQFECWNRGPIEINDQISFHRAHEIIKRVLASNDPTNGCDHYNNPDKEGYPAWTQNTHFMRKIGNHQFYKTKW